jgi:hypothetical protein
MSKSTRFILDDFTRYYFIRFLGRPVFKADETRIGVLEAVYKDSLLVSNIEPCNGSCLVVATPKGKGSTEQDHKIEFPEGTVCKRTKRLSRSERFYVCLRQADLRPGDRCLVKTGSRQKVCEAVFQGFRGKESSFAISPEESKSQAPELVLMQNNGDFRVLLTPQEFRVVVYNANHLFVGESTVRVDSTSQVDDTSLSLDLHRLSESIKSGDRLVVEDIPVCYPWQEDDRVYHRSIDPKGKWSAEAGQFVRWKDATAPTERTMLIQIEGADSLLQVPLGKMVDYKPLLWTAP